jgi:hyperosmotically inducible periplasmic protein
MLKSIRMSFVLGIALLAVGCSTQEVDDPTLAAAVKGKLAMNADTRAVTIGVASDKGVVTLSGTVPSATERTRAEEVATKTVGVKSVINGILVTPRPAPAQAAAGETVSTWKDRDDPFDKTPEKTERAVEKAENAISDAAILTTIRTHLLTVGIDATEMDVTNGKVVLRGEVRTARSRSEAETFAKNVDGVKSVQNLLTVKKSAE